MVSSGGEKLTRSSQNSCKVEGCGESGKEKGVGRGFGKSLTAGGMRLGVRGRSILRLEVFRGKWSPTDN